MVGPSPRHFSTVMYAVKMIEKKVKDELSLEWNQKRRGGDHGVLPRSLDGGEVDPRWSMAPPRPPIQGDRRGPEVNPLGTYSSGR